MITNKSGVVYDVNELDRVKGWIAQQQEQFVLADAEKNKKEWIIVSSVVVFSFVGLIFLVKKVS